MRGFTLIESITYIGLFTLLLSTAIVGTESVTQSIDRTNAQALLETEGDFLLAKIALNPTTISLVDGSFVDNRTIPGTPLSTPEVNVSEFSHSSPFYTFTLSVLTSTGQQVSSTFSTSVDSLP